MKIEINRRKTWISTGGRFLLCGHAFRLALSSDRQTNHVKVEGKLDRNESAWAEWVRRGRSLTARLSCRARIHAKPRTSATVLVWPHDAPCFSQIRCFRDVAIARKFVLTNVCSENELISKRKLQNIEPQNNHRRNQSLFQWSRLFILFSSFS